MPTVTPFLWFDNNLEEAINFYDNIFENVKIDGIQKGPDGTVFGASFEIENQAFMGLNGGPDYTFNESVSFFISCDTQEEIDYYWESLTAHGGTPGRCGWLKDKFGLSWQVVPAGLPKILNDDDPAKAQAAMQAMLKMNKLNITKLEAAKDAV